jgi:hypothetical protein
MTVCVVRFNIKKFYMLPIEYIHVFHMILTINSDYLHVKFSSNQLIDFTHCRSLVIESLQRTAFTAHFHTRILDK